MEQEELKPADGRRRSGQARMEKLTSEERSELAKKAARRRWNVKDGNMEVYEAFSCADLEIADQLVPCAVLMVDGEPIRVVSERGLVKSFGGKRGGPLRFGGNLDFDFGGDLARSGLVAATGFDAAFRSGLA